MEVACSKCGARGRVPDEQLAAGPVKVRCAACQTVVRVEPPSAQSRSARVDAWYLDSGQGAQGPYRIGELVALWRSDRISWNAKLWREGDPEWSPARGHGAFIDAIFAHDERARAAAAAGGEQPASAAPSSPSAIAGAAAREHTTPSFPATALASMSASVAPPRTEERTPHDSLAPFERASHAPSPRWPLAIVLGSVAIAGGVVLWAVRAQPPSSPQPPTAAVAADYEQPAPAVVPAAALEAAPSVAAEAEGRALVEPTAVPTGEASPPVALDSKPAAGLAAGTAPGRSAGLAPATAPATAVRAARADDDERLRQEHAAAEDVAGDDDVVAVGSADDSAQEAAAPASARTRSPDFMTPAETLPDLPTTREIATAVRSVAPAVRACAGALGPTTVYVSVAITGATGRVARVQVPSVSSELQRCISDAVRAASFPHFERAELELRFPFLIGG
ncbi:MAG TPA: zinc-ribbon domain-containing protein [Polyangiales bacterium]|nr:zinc-ribbon domain-containing protein [Polyangiales bacterium]